MAYKGVLERVRQARNLDPEAMLGCPACMAKSPGEVPGGLLSWRGVGKTLPLERTDPPALATAQRSQHVTASRAYCRHLEEVHDVAADAIRRRHLPVVLYSPQAADLLQAYLLRQLVSSLL